MCKVTAITKKCSRCNENVIVTLVPQLCDQRKYHPESDTPCADSTIEDDEGNKPANWKVKILVHTNSRRNQCGHLGYVPFNHRKDHLNGIAHCVWADVCKIIGWRFRIFEAPDEARY